MPTVRTIGILRAQATVGGIFVDHRIHTAWRDAEEETWTTEFLEVAEVSVPVGLRYDSHFIACGLQDPPDDGNTEGGVIDIGIT